MSFSDDQASLYHIDAYDYPLPSHLIAAHPLPERDASRMMLLERATNTFQHRQFKNLVDLLRPGDLLVVNNTKVLPARFIGQRRDADGLLHGGKAEVLLLHPAGQGQENQHTWHCLMKPARRMKPGVHLNLPDTQATLEVVGQGDSGHGVVRLHLPEGMDVETFMQRHGNMPIPPYFNREATEADKERYQTVYSKVEGSQAAPTAGLHFTPAVLNALEAKGVRRAEVTLSVGVGTFRPVMVEDIRAHDMHAEAYTLAQETIDAMHETRANGGRIIAVGTTSCKTLETAAKNQGGFPKQAESGWSDLYIMPGFKFQAVDGMLTNFHLPKSTLMMMISAFAGSREFVLEAYRAAVTEQYRFYSYGDCMLIL